jgi:S-adenosyl-L-methionine hydrolase (adenosine-forming)
MARPVLALLTDFGVRDHYVGVMKGVALSVCPDATLVDITHDIPPQDVRAGALAPAAAYRYFPNGTVFVTVVDPGVGSARRAVAVETATYRFVAPDNGLLTPVIAATEPWRAVALETPRYARAEISRTFEGRDRFAPAAAWLARGVPLAELGPGIDQLMRLDARPPSTGTDGIVGEVVRVDRFGNLVTNIDRQALARVGLAAVAAAGERAEIPLVSTYADAPGGTLCALVGSDDYLELAVNGGSAAVATGLGVGAAVRVRHRA